MDLHRARWTYAARSRLGPMLPTNESELSPNRVSLGRHFNYARSAPMELHPTPIPKRDSDRGEFENRPLETRFQHVEVDKRELNSENTTRGVLELRSRSAASTERNRNLSGAISVYDVWKMRFVRLR